MTSEDDFQRMLDAHPKDATARRVFADWLEERGEARAEGYRALGVIQANFALPGVPTSYIGNEDNAGLVEERQSSPGWMHRDSLLPGDWFREIPLPADAPDWHKWFWRQFDTRRAAEDAAALAFARLPAERRAELLAGKAVSA